MGQIENQEIHIVENMIHNCKKFQIKAHNKAAKDSMVVNESKIHVNYTQRLNKGKVEEAFPQTSANSTAYFSQFEYSNYEETNGDQYHATITTTHQNSINSAAVLNNDDKEDMKRNCI